MKVTYLALKMISKQKLLNLFLIVTIVLSIYYLSPVLSQLIHFATSSQDLSRLEMDHSYYLYTNPHYSKRDPNLKDSIDEKVSSIGYVADHAESYNLYSSDSSISIVSYNNTLIDNFMPNMKSGIWLNNAKMTDHIPIVVSNDMDLECGEITSLEIIAKDNVKSFSCEVVGVLEPNTNVIGLSGAADDEYFTADALLKDAAFTVILPLTTEIKSYISDEAYLLCANGSILYTSAGTRYEDVLNDFGYAGIVTDLGAGNNRFLEQSKLIVIAMGAYFTLYLVITVICLLCSNFILNISAKRIYTIYFLTGMSYMKRTVIEILRVFLLIFISTVISYIFLYKSGIIQIYFENTAPVFVLAAILLYISLIFIPVSAIFISRNHKKDMIDSIRNLNIEI